LDLWSDVVGKKSQKWQLIDALLVDLAQDPAAQDSLSKLGLVGLIAWREAHLYQPLGGRTEPGPAQIAACDLDWLNHITELEQAELIAYGVGIGAADTPIAAALENGQAGGRIREELRHGINEGVQRSVSFKERRQPDPEIANPIAKKISETADQLAKSILLDVISDLPRKSLLRLLNMLILIEEATDVAKTGSDRPVKERRKLAIEYALMRYLCAIPMLQEADLDQITEIFRLTGRAARLSNPVSDGLDRVEKYARKARSDPDSLEAGRAAGRPLSASPSDLLAAARQCRKFRDRERA
jgi:hypothetical protein